MKTNKQNHTIALSTHDAASIRKLLRQAEITAAGLPPPACLALENLLEHASILDPEHPALESRVGLCDPVTLISPEDRSDWYQMEIVPPAEACVEEDRISLAHPMSLAGSPPRRDRAMGYRPRLAHDAAGIHRKSRPGRCLSRHRPARNRKSPARPRPCGGYVF